MRELAALLTYETPTRVHMVIDDPNFERWHVPGIALDTTSRVPLSQTEYDIVIYDEPFAWAVIRRGCAVAGMSVWNSSAPAGAGFRGTIFEDQFIEFGTTFMRGDDPSIYGLGEHVVGQPLPKDGHVYTLFNKDQQTPPDLNLYGSHPFYVYLSQLGPAHGVLFLNSNPMNVILNDGDVTFRTIGGIIDLYIFLGPTPALVVDQYTQLVGRPFMPPYWSLGFHQCRWGYHTLEETAAVVEQYAANDLPLDTMWNDIDYMDLFQDFTTSPVRFPGDKMRAFIDQLHADGQHYVMIIDPGIHIAKGYAPYDELLASGAYVRKSDGVTPFTGMVWPGHVIFPDWLHDGAASFWADQIATFHKTIPFDGLWIDMNEASNFCTSDCGGDVDDRYTNPPYSVVPATTLNDRTIGMNAVHNTTIEYNCHNMYGFLEAQATTEALKQVTGKRAFVIGRSTFVGYGRMAGHWLGDNWSQYTSMAGSVPDMLAFGLEGVVMTGADICGFSDDTTPELCTRWMQLGMFYPFSRNHNNWGKISQEPYVFDNATMSIMRTWLYTRYELLPYTYTLFYQASTSGTPVTRPLWFEFREDLTTHKIDTQFLFGPALLVSPVLDEGVRALDVYLPAGVWYGLRSGVATSVTAGETVTLPAPLEDILVHVRGGYIVPTQVPARTTTASRRNPFGAIVAFDANGDASGTLYLDDGESLDVGSAYTLVNIAAGLDANGGTVDLKATPSPAAYAAASWGTLLFYGVPFANASATVNGAPHSCVSIANGILSVCSISVPVNAALAVHIVRA